jgi:hypothetical protein
MVKLHRSRRKSGIVISIESENDATKPTLCGDHDRFYDPGWFGRLRADSRCNRGYRNRRGSGNRPRCGLNVDTAFAAVERGATIGSTGTTGAGFSALSVSPNTGGARAGGLGGLGGFGGLGGLGGFGGFGGGLGSGAANTEPAIRTRLRSAVEVPPLQPTYIQARANQRFYRAPDRAGVDNVAVTMQGGTAIVTGTVASERDRRMSELLMRLEPGVRRVDNRVIVAPR